MPTHKGQIGFMGGHKKVNESCPTVTAQREFTEESSIASDKIDILGMLKPVVTSHRKLIVPVVARVKITQSDFLHQLNSNGEWDNIVLAPLDHLRDSSLWSKGSYNTGNQAYPIYFAPLSLDTCTYLKQVKSPYILWGASAKMVLNFLNLVNPVIETVSN